MRKCELRMVRKNGTPLAHVSFVGENFASLSKAIYALFDSVPDSEIQPVDILYGDDTAPGTLMPLIEYLIHQASKSNTLRRNSDFINLLYTLMEITK